MRISIDALAAAWLGNFIAYTGGLPQSGRTYGGLRKGSDLLLESNKGFNRTIYHLHQEIDLVCNDSRGFERFYKEAEELIKDIGARPHLGKYCESFDMEDLEKLHGKEFARFLDLKEEHDPYEKFANDFTRRLFGNRGRSRHTREEGPEDA